MNYSEIKSLALSYADRESDTELPGRLDDFLRVIEPRINRAFRTLKMSERATMDIVEDQEYYGLPVQFNGLRDIELRSKADKSYRKTMKFRNPEQMNNIVDTGDTSNIYYTLIGDQLHIVPNQTSDKYVEIVYYSNLTPLTEANSTNWVSVYHPDAYIHGLMVEISAYTKDANAATLWEARFKEALNEIQNQDNINRWSGTPLTIQFEG